MKYGVGQAVRRKEDVRLVTGRGQYIDDLNFEGTVFACFVRSPHAHAVIRSVDTSAAHPLPGFIGAITAKDVAATGYVPVRGAFKNRDGSAMHQSPKRLLPDDKVRDEARAMARVFATKSRTTMRLGRTAFMRVNDRDYRRGIGDAVENFCNVAATADAQEGVRAFIEKRSPNW